MAFEKHDRPDGTFFIYKVGENKHLNHVHMAPDGTVLSWKVEGEHIFNRAQIRKAIKDLAGIEMDPGWRG